MNDDLTYTPEDIQSESPAFLFYVGDFRGSKQVARMNLEEEGAYVRVLCWIWDNLDCAIEDDDEALAELSGLGLEKWRNGSGKKLRNCLVAHAYKDGFLTNERLIKERIKLNEKKKKRVDAAKAGAEGRRKKKIGDEKKRNKKTITPKNKGVEQTQSKRSADDVRLGSITSSISISSSISNKPGEGEGSPSPPPPVFFKILKTCQGIRRVVFGVREPFDKPKDAAIVQEFIDQGYSSKQIQLAFFFFCIWHDKWLDDKPRTMPLFKSQVKNYWGQVNKAVSGGVRFQQGRFDWKPKDIEAEKMLEEKKNQAQIIKQRFKDLSEKELTDDETPQLLDIREKAVALIPLKDDYITYIIENINDYLEKYPVHLE